MPLDSQHNLRRPKPLVLGLLVDFTDSNALSANPYTVRRNLSVIRKLCFSQGILRPSEITVAAIEKFLAGLLRQGRTVKTVENYKGAISRFCRFLVSRDVLAKNPCSEIITFPKVSRMPIFLSIAESEQILAWAKTEGICAEVCLALNTGLRMNELRMLEWVDVDLVNHFLFIRKSKSRRFRKVDLNPKARVALRYQRRKTGQWRYVFAGGRQRKDGKSGCRCWNRNAPRRVNWWVEVLHPIQEAMPVFQQLPKQSVGRGWHLFRHTFASRLAQRGVSIQKISAWLGHKSISTTQIYAHLSPDYDSDIEKA